MSSHVVERILGAARQLLESGDPSAITFRSVARLAECSPGTVVYYFETREQLMEATLDPHHDLVGEVLDQGHTTAEHSGTSAEQTTDSLVTYALESRELMRLQLVAWCARWSLPEHRLQALRGRLDRVEGLPWKPDWTPPQRRVLIQLSSYGVQRFACMADEELLAVTGLDDLDAARQAINTVATRLISAFVGA